MKQILAHFLACLTQLILTKKQGFLDHRSIWCNKGDDSRLIWPQNGFALWSSLSEVVPWKPHSQREIQTDTGHPLHMAHCVHAFGSGSDISLKPHSLAPHLAPAIQRGRFQVPT